MKRFLVTLAIVLLLGAVINIAVAWGLVWQEPPARRSGSYQSPLLPPHFYELWEQRGRAFLISSQYMFARRNYEYAPDRYPLWSIWTDRSFKDEDRAWLEQATGWPMLAVASAIGFERPFWKPEIVRAGFLIEWQNDPLQNRLLGYRPLWPGFAVNTVFYAAIVWLLLAIPTIVKRSVRKRRIKRGLCARCAYPVGASAVCSECGTAVPR